MSTIQFIDFKAVPPAAPPSGWGKLNGGHPWLPYCFNFGRALSRARLGDYEAAVFWYIVERSWGGPNRTKGRSDAWPDAIPVEWLLGPISAELRMPEKRVSEGKCSLVRSLMLFEMRGWLLVNKQANEWVWPAGHAHAGSPRLSPEAIEYAIEGVSPRPYPGNLGIVSRNSGIAVPEYRDVNPGISGRESRNIGIAVPEFRDSHIEERARSEDSQKIEEEKERGKESVPPSSLPQGEEPKGPRFTGNGHLPGDHAPDMDVLDTIRALIDSQFNPLTNNRDLWSKIRHHQHVWPTAWILKAVKRACIKNKKPTLPPSWNFVRIILQEWDQLNGPDAGPEDDVDDRLVHKPQTAEAAGVVYAVIPDEARAAMDDYYRRIIAEAKSKRVPIIGDYGNGTLSVGAIIGREHPALRECSEAWFPSERTA
jgi:hypothetical protein